MTQTTIVLGCSRTKRTHLASVVETLAGRGNVVEVVSGLDETDEPWRDVIHRLGSDGVYILCSDENVNLRRVGQLRALLGDAGVPSSRAWCGPVDWSKPQELVRHVEHLLESRNIKVEIPTPVAKAKGPSEMSGTVVAPPSLTTPSMPSPDPSASHTFVATQISKPFNWKPAAALGGVALLIVAAAVPVLGSSDEVASETEDAEIAVSAIAAEPTPAQVAPTEPEQAADPVELEAEDPESTAQTDLTAATSPAERDAIFRALSGQKVRALDILLIAPEAKSITRRGNKITARLDFESAFTYCSELDIDGLGRWRLPTAGELASLSSQRMLAKGVYWSETEGDSFGNERVVWSVRKKRMKPMRRSYTGARTLCVRHIAEK